MSAFVAAHSTAQEVFSAHFAEDDAEASHTAMQDTGTKASSTCVPDASAAAADTSADVAAGSRHIGLAHNSSSKVRADTNVPGDQPSTQGDGTAFPPKSRDVEDADTQLARQVVRESRAEADAALQYAHDVSLRCVGHRACIFGHQTALVIYRRYASGSLWRPGRAQSLA